jgi:hypothetical protein
VKDDFGWILFSTVRRQSDLNIFLEAPTGFYRPAVALSFALNRMACGVQPFCYGLTNFALVLASAASVFLLARGLQRPPGVALLASARWVFNWHGINMATLWISGRTALLLVLFSTSAASAFVRRRYMMAAILTLGAMLSREEAVLVPAALLASLPAVPHRSRLLPELPCSYVCRSPVEPRTFFCGLDPVPLR